jgi:hypothetical protein
VETTAQVLSKYQRRMANMTPEERTAFYRAQHEKRCHRPLYREGARRRNKRWRDNLTPEKKEQQRQAQQRWYQDNREKVMARAQAQYQRLPIEKKQAYRKIGKAVAEKNRYWLNEIKRVMGCYDCGEDNPVVLEFDHRDPTQKLFSISEGIGFAAARLMQEVEKCDVVCANCHRIRTAEYFQWKAAI